MCGFHGKVITLLVKVAFCFTASLAVAAEDPFASAVRPTNALTPAEEEQALHVPPGFRVQLFASEPDIQKPLNMAFDSRGRLWVSGTVDYPFPNQKQPGDSIRILEDTDGDGRADRFTTFVDKITHPMGLLPYRDGVIAYCIPNIWFFEDRDGDGCCDHRELLYGPFDFSRDTHGMTNAFRRGFDGWIYACHGFANHSVVTGRDGNTVTMTSGNTYRFRPDGSRIEHFTHGQINPFGMTFDFRGDLFNSDCHTKPLTLLIREGQYQGFGRQHDGLGFVPEVMHHSHGSTAIAGAMQLTDRRLPENLQGQFLEGNVMTSRVNRDSLSYSGSSMTAVEQPDFLASDDPWFRPVDLQLGPDGAIYIADFYNKIIGHYEVPLNHPDRDRHRGRIWRVEYVGADHSRSTLAQVANLRTAKMDEVIAATGELNLPRRICAIDELSDRLGTEAVPEVRKALHETADDTIRVSLLWTLHRLSVLTESELLTAARSPVEIVRLHAQRILTETPAWNDELRSAALAGLRDVSPFVQRAAAEALGQHPHADQFRPLLSLWQSCPESDVMLRYQLKVALRNQLRQEGVLQQLRAQGVSSEERTAIAEFCLGLDSQDAASFLLSSFSDPSFVPQNVESLVERLAKWATTDEQMQLIDVLQSRYRDDPEFQLRLLQATRKGFQQQKVDSSDPLKNWATRLVRKILKTQDTESGWRLLPDGSGVTAAWDFEFRSSVDSPQPLQLFSSLPAGEQAVSTLRSPDFVIPPQLNFLICGHLGFPNEPARPVNFVRLRLVDSDQEIERALPPRNDIAQPVSWNLQKYAGQKGYLEIVDGLDLAAYAWIAFGRLEPAVMTAPPISGVQRQKRLAAAALLAGEMELQGVAEELISLLQQVDLNSETRGAAATAIARLDGTPEASALAVLWHLPDISPEQLKQAESALIDTSLRDQRLKILSEITKTLSTRFQVEIAQAMLSRDGGIALLLEMCESNSISPRVLVSSSIRPRVEATRQIELKHRMKQLLEKLPAASAEKDERINQLSQQFVNSTPDATFGRKVFESKCAACHQVQGVGKVIGPQLDGIGSRGAERLFEDILDPNRNVDHSFRSRTYSLENGKIYSGIFRRQEGALIVIADNQGNEHSFAESDVEDQAVSNVSIMPDNWGEIIPEAELCALMAFLLEQRK
ncbi:PVC-type heme-binding CxxCH protein [Planctomicrobium sp. SH661]|uniref:PVC-type heme-binding CxxCH protein n=1 Tax=Planctomicrobium sp. SH661 TaxID=3448124 RepID=UPI003F5BD3D2